MPRARDQFEQSLFTLPEKSVVEQTPVVAADYPNRIVIESFMDEDGRQKPLPIVVNHEQVEAVLGTLMSRYREGGYPYNLDTVRTPQDPRHMPETLPLGGAEHAMFLWTSCYYMRGGIKSVEAFKRLSSMYREAPELFDPHFVVDNQIPAERIAELLGRNGLGFQGAVSSAWKTNASRLVDMYDGDPRKIFDGVTNFEEAFKRIGNDGKGGGFIGFQEKMTSMIIYYLRDQELIEPFNFPIPVDIHVMRVSIANELISFPGVSYGTDLFRHRIQNFVTSLLLQIVDRFHARVPGNKQNKGAIRLTLLLKRRKVYVNLPERTDEIHILNKLLFGQTNSVHRINKPATCDGVFNLF